MVLGGGKGQVVVGHVAAADLEDGQLDLQVRHALDVAIPH